MTVMRRVGAHAGPWVLVAVLGLTVVFLLAATPRTVNRIQDRALRRTVADAPYTVRDLLISGAVPSTFQGWPDAQRLLDDVYRSLPAPLPAMVGSRWGAVRSGLLVLDGPDVTRAPSGLRPKVALLHHTGLSGGVRLVEGGPPHNGPGPTSSVDVMVAEPVARNLGLRTGSSYELRSNVGGALPIRVTGLFALLDEASTAWAPYPTLNRTGIVTEGPAGDPVERVTGTLVTDQAGISVLQQDPATWGLVSELRFRLDERRIDADDVAPLREAVARTRSSRSIVAHSLRTGLDDLLADFARQAAAVQALLAVVVAGTAGTALVLLLLAARLAVDRRHGELALLRARGASLRGLAGRLAAEAAVVVLPAVAIGWLASAAVPGRAPPAAVLGAGWPAVFRVGWPAVFRAGWPPVAAAVLAILAVPLAAAAAHRQMTARVPRRDLVRTRPAPLRRTVEVTLGVLAAAGVVLVRRRGISQAGVDPYLAAVPVLAGTAVGLLALRLFPWPVRVLGRLAASGRGGVAFVGLARAGRAPAGSALPLVALVLAVAIGGFAGSVRVGVSAARDLAAARLVGGDLRVSAAELAPDALERVTRVPGVTAVASGYLAAPGSVRLSDVMPVDLTMAVLVLDVAAYQRVLERTGIDLRLPAELATPRPDGALPVVASPRLARETALTVRLDGPARRLQVVGTLDALPGLSRVDFVVIPREALGTGAVRRNLLFVAGPRADPTAVRAAARVLPQANAEDPVGPGMPVVPGDATVAEPGEVTVLVRVHLRQALERSAFNDGISLAFDIAAVAALLAGVAAVGLALMVDAAARGRVLSLLRTMGLAPGQARWLLLVELLPLTVTALVAGAALGVVLPVLLAPALGLQAFAAGTPVTVGLDGRSVGLLVGLLLVLATAGVLGQAAANRRLGLGQVLRVEERL